MRRRRMLTLATAGLLTLGAVATSLVIAEPASAVVICEQFGSTTAGDYRIMNNRWGTSATQCINTTANGFTIQQQDGRGNFSGAPTAYPAIYLGCHYSSCSPSTALPRQISTIGSAPGSITLSYPNTGSWNAAYDVWINADNNTTGVQDTEIMIWLNRFTAEGNIQPIGSAAPGTVNIAGRSWQVWTGNNGQNNVVSYLFQGSPLTSFSFDVMNFVRDTFSRGSQFGNNSWWLTSVQAGFEPWAGGVGLTVNSFSQTVSGTTGGVPGTPGTPVASGVTSSSVTLNWAASSGTVNNYQIERCTGAGCTGFAQLGTSTSTTFTNSGLAANTTYRYRVRAANSAGNSPYSGIVDVMTTGTGTQPPGTPGTLSAPSTTASTVNLTWGASSGTVSNYQIERCTGANCTNFGQVATSTTTSFTDGGLAANTTYRYRVRATNSAGNSGYSNIATAVTTGGGGGGGCSATLTTQTSWNNGYVMQPNSVTNTGTATITSWTVTFTLPAGHTITNFWNANVTVSGQTVTARGIPGQTGTLGPNASTAWGFQATRPTGNTQLPQGPTCTSP